MLREFIEVVKQGKVTKDEKRQFWAYVNTFEETNVLLGCTELPLLMNGAEIEKKVIDPLDVVVNSL